MSSHVHYISYRKSLTIFYEAISVQIQNWLIADLQRSLMMVLRMELQGESEIPVSNNLLGNTVGRRLLPSETVVHDRRLLECKIWYDSCLMSSIKHLPSYHSLYCFRVDTTSKFLRKQDLWTKVELRSSKRGRGKLVANVQWVSSLLFLFISTLNNRVRHLIPFGNQKTQKKAPFSTMFKIPTKKRCGKWKVLVLMPFWEVLYSSCRIIFCVCKWGTRT